MDQIQVRTKGGAIICVPQSIGLMTPYVLLEQEDWFEKEIGFVRRMLRPGMRVLDVGANYGVYALSMAKAVGAPGRVWAYEPASATAAFLRRSLERNDFEHVVVRQIALSNRHGHARLRLENNAELNALSSDATSNSEEVPLTTLDHEYAAQAFGNIDFVKLDAEGEEVNILAGGERFLGTQSPLVMFELKHGDIVNTELPAAFRTRGYDLYRLVGPDCLLVPHRIDEPADGYELNLFACKPDRAAMLAEAGLLTHAGASTLAAPRAGLTLWRNQNFASAFEVPDHKVEPRYAEALDQYAAWRDAGRPLAERYGALLASLAALKTHAQNSENLATLSTLARTAVEAGERRLAVDVLSKMLNLMSGKSPQVNGPFWPVGSRYDELPPGKVPADWFVASVIESFERLRSFSSYFAAPSTLVLLDWLQRTPFASAEMERRRQLMRIRAGLLPGIVPAAILAVEGPDNLNPGYWHGRA